MIGVDHYTAASGFHVISIHYTADPARNPANPEGLAWREEESRGIPGGINSAQWRQEQEIDWNVAGGELVFPHIAMYRERIIVSPFVLPSTWDFYGSYDHGHRNPACFLIMAVDHDGDVWIVWEMYQSNLGFRDIARKIRACPYFETLAFPPIADPSIWAKTQHQTDESEMKSIARLFWELPEDEQVCFVPGIRGGDIMVAERIRGDLWRNEDMLAGKNPRLKIFANCPKTIWEFTNLRYEDWTNAMMQTRNQKESIVDKNNHAWDSFKMFMNQFFMATKEPKQDALDRLKKIDPASWAEWMAVRRLCDTKVDGIMGDFDG